MKQASPSRQSPGRRLFRRQGIIAALAVGFCAVLVGLGGCAPAGAPGEEPIILDTTGVEPSLDTSDLADVLAADYATDSDVRKYYLIDPLSSEKTAEELDRQLRRYVVTGPETTPERFDSPEAELAYWYNVRAAWSLKLLLLKDVPRRLRRGGLYERRFPVDGRLMTLEDIDAILARDADWRALAAAPCVKLTRARLPRSPFTAAGIRERIAERLSDFVDDERRFVIDRRERVIRVPPVIWRYRDRLIAEHNAGCRTCEATLATALLPYTRGSAHRRLQDAVGLRCVRAPETDEIARAEDF